MTDVRIATPGDTAELADILADAFSTDAVMTWVFGGPPTVQLFESMIRGTYMPRGTCYLSDGAAALWTHSDVVFKPQLRELAYMLRPMLALGGLGSLRRGLGAQNRMGKVHPKAPHQYLFAVGTRQSMQGRGLGKKILAPMLAQCDAEGIGAYLENSKPENTPFYRGLGFQLSSDPFPVGRDAPSLMPMWRDAGTLTD